MLDATSWSRSTPRAWTRSRTCTARCARGGIRLVVAGLQRAAAARRCERWGLDALIGAANLFADRAGAFAALGCAEREVVHEITRVRRRGLGYPFARAAASSAVGYLDELKRQADEALALQTQDIGALRRNSLLTDVGLPVDGALLRHAGAPAQRAAADVEGDLALRQPRPPSDQLRFSDFRADSRMKKLRDAEVFDHVVLSFAAKTGTRVTIAKDFPPEIEQLEARLRQCGAHFESEVIRDAENGQFVEKRFELTADFHSSVRVLPDHDAARIAFHVAKSTASRR